MSRSYVVLLFVPILLAGCSSGAVASATAQPPTLAPAASAVSANATAAPLPIGVEASPAAEAPPEDAVAAALEICTSPECEYPRLSPGSVHLPPDTATAADRWCVQAHFTMEGQDTIYRTYAVLHRLHSHLHNRWSYRRYASDVCRGLPVS